MIRYLEGVYAVMGDFFEKKCGDKEFIVIFADNQS